LASFFCLCNSKLWPVYEENKRQDDIILKITTLLMFPTFVLSFEYKQQQRLADTRERFFSFPIVFYWPGSMPSADSVFVPQALSPGHPSNKLFKILGSGKHIQIFSWKIEGKKFHYFENISITFHLLFIFERKRIVMRDVSDYVRVWEKTSFVLLLPQPY